LFQICFVFLSIELIQTGTGKDKPCINVVNIGKHFRSGFYEYVISKGGRFVMTMLQLDEMKNMSIDNTNKEDLIDISALTVDQDLDKYERIEKFIHDVRNPYLFKVGDTVVKVQFGESQKTLQESITKMLDGWQ